MVPYIQLSVSNNEILGNVEFLVWRWGVGLMRGGGGGTRELHAWMGRQQVGGGAG